MTSGGSAGKNPQGWHSALASFLFLSPGRACALYLVRLPALERRPLIRRWRRKEEDKQRNQNSQGDYYKRHRADVF